MSEMNLRQRAHRYLKTRSGQWVNGGELERLALNAGYKGSTISRELRKLAEESRDRELDLGGFVLRQEVTGKRTRSVEYCWVPQKTDRVTRHLLLDWNKDALANFDKEE